MAKRRLRSTATNRQKPVALPPPPADGAGPGHRCRSPARPARRQTRRWPAVARPTTRFACPRAKPPTVRAPDRLPPKPGHAAARAARPGPANHRRPTDGPEPAATGSFPRNRCGRRGSRSNFRVASRHPAIRHRVRGDRSESHLPAGRPAYRRARHRLWPAGQPKRSATAWRS